MRVPDKKWASKPEYQSLLYFCQLLDDMVWEWTRESHRAPSTNTYHLCLEAMRTWEEAHSSSLREGILSPILEELHARSHADFTITAHFGEHRERLDFALNTETATSSKVGAVARFYRSIENSHLKRCRDEIQRIVAKPKAVEEEKLAQLAGNFCSYLQNIGYTTRYISRVLNNAFIFKEIHGAPVRALQEFFAEFSGRELKFNVIMAVSEQLANAGSGIHFEIYNEKVPTFGRGLNPFSSVATGNEIVQFCDVVALDAYSATATVEGRLALVRAAAYTARPDALLAWQPESIVTDLKTRQPLLVPERVEPLRQRYRDHASYDYRAVGEKIRTIFEEKLPSQDANRLKSALLGYSNAFHSESPATQLVAVWSSLEGLLPPIQSGESRIDAILRHALACQRAVYLRNLFKWSFLDHLELDRDHFFELIDKVSGSSERLSKFISILCFPQHKVLSEALGDFAAKSPLTSQRGFRLHKAAKKVGDLQSLVDSHERKVSWQLRRIYRERNRIVHQANPSTNVDSLILNLNEYLTVVYEVLFTPNETRPYDMGLNDIFSAIVADENFRTRKARAIANEPLSEVNAAVVLGFRLN